MSTNLEVLRRRVKIEKHQKVIQEIQNSCTHPKETLYYTNHSNTGNYDPSSDCYWAVYDCQLCGKVWSDDQGKFEGVKFNVY